MHNTSNISETDKKLWEYFNDEKMNITETVPTDQGFVVGIYSALFVVGAAGNVSVFVSLVRSRRRKSRVNLLMTHLAVADMIVTFIVIPFEIGWRTTNAWLAGNWACKFFLVLRAFGLYLSSNVLVCISLDRYFAVLHPLRLAVARTRSKTMLWFAWLVAFICSLPQVQDYGTDIALGYLYYRLQSLVFRVMHHPTVPEFQQCVSFEAFSNPHQELAYNVMCLSAMYFVPLIIITVCYICIFSEIHTNSKEVTDKSLPTDTGRIQLRRSDRRPLARARRRTLRMTVTIVSVFACCWLPYATMTLWYMFDRESAVHVSGKVQDLFFIMAVSNSCMDPLVYGSYTLDMNIINRSIRKVFCVHDNVSKANATISGPDNYGCKARTKEIVHPGNQYMHRRQYTVAFQETSLIPSANSEPVPIWVENNIQIEKKDDVLISDRF